MAVIRPVNWLGSSLEDLKAMPEPVQDEIGFALYVAQKGETHRGAKHMKGMSGVYEIVSDFNTDTFRAVYVVRFADAVYVLHAFQKKSHKGAQIPKRDRELIERRLADLIAERKARKRN